MSDDQALVELLHLLRQQGYRHIVVTPATHARVVDRPLRNQPDLVDIFGWNRRFTREAVHPMVLELLERASAVRFESDGGLRSDVRVASLGEDLLVHSAYPTDQQDSVFFGPDTYRFASFLMRNCEPAWEQTRIVDMGTGSGAGGLVAARRIPSSRLTLVDVNPKALRLASINLAAAELQAETVQSDRVPDDFDVLIANPPYLIDAKGRSYRDGGDLLGGAVTLDWVRQGLAGLQPRRQMLFYTGVAYEGGNAPLLDAVERECQSVGAMLEIEEIDPDVFGEQLEEAGYETVERIAAVGIIIRPGLFRS